MRVFTVTLAVLVSACFAASFGRTVNLSHSLQLQTISTGWVDAGTLTGKTKLVPTISFILKNRSDQTLKMLQVNALFGRIGDEDEWGNALVTAAGPAGLVPGATTAPMTVTSSIGYTGAESRTALLGHSQFIDARVDLFAKYGSTPWTRLGRYRITREWLAR
jgi:hypothetical protein